jgi:hypothetical protein
VKSGHDSLRLVGLGASLTYNLGVLPKTKSTNQSTKYKALSTKF